MKIYEANKTDFAEIVLEIIEDILPKRIMSSLVIDTDSYGIKEMLDFEGYEYNKKEPTILVSELQLDGSFYHLKPNFTDQELDELLKIDILILVCSGPKYQNILKTITESEAKKDIPASFIYEFKDCIIVADELALRKIPQEE